MAKSTKATTPNKTTGKVVRNAQSARFVTVDRVQKMEAGVIGYAKGGRLTDAQARAAVRQVLGRK